MQVFIPALGTKLLLTKSWTFDLHDESRNYEFWIAFHGQPPTRPAGQQHKYIYGGYAAAPSKVTIKAGTTLSVDRIYIRKGASSFDSVSFRVLKGGPTPPGRFWVKLCDVNNGMEVTVVP
jgi:hypothetical protein